MPSGTWQPDDPAPWPEHWQITCPACGGDGGWEADETGPAVTCRRCDGERWIETEHAGEDDCICGSLFDAECPRHGKDRP